MERNRLRTDGGFSLLEALVAVTLLAVVLTSIGQLGVVAVASGIEARHQSVLTAAAVEKMEQLRALAWGHDGSNLPVSDTTSDVSHVPSRASGGPGLLPSPAGTLDHDTPGYVDYLAADGSWLGSGSPPGGGAVYVRRWSVTPLASHPLDALVFVVRAGRFAQPSGGAASTDLAGAVTLATIRIRAGG